MSYTIQKIAQLLEGELLNSVSLDSSVIHLLYDSRQVIYPKSALFFAMNGKHHNGHDYIPALYKKGVKHFVVAEKIDAHTYPNANFIVVDNTLTALQKLVIHHRNQFSLTTIGITGSNGKTIVKELLFQLLRNKYKIVRSPKSYNSQIGVPLSVWQINKQHDLGIFEAGISEKGEMEKLAPIINCDIGIFTNIGPAHDKGFDNIQQKIDEKLQLYKNTKSIVYCNDQAELHASIVSLPNKSLFSWSKTQAADLQILSIEKLANNQTIINGSFEKEEVSIQIPFADKAYIENSIHCWATLLLMKIPQQEIKTSMLTLEPVAMRLELKEGINDSIIINDSYNSDLGSLAIALHFLQQQSSKQNHTLILSDILQSGQSVDLLYKDVAHLIVDKDITRLFAIGTDITHLKQYLPDHFNATFYANTPEFLSTVQADDFAKEAILLKGARSFNFEKIANRLSQKMHKTVLEVNLSALTQNLHVYSRYLEPNVKIMVMVKASAYGSGSLEVARLLEFNKVDYLAVAYADEGISLREAGIQLPIMVLNPEEQSLDKLISNQLEAEVYSFSLLKQLIAAANNKPLNIHLKLDTGMHRLGFTESDIPELTSLLAIAPNLHVRSIFSHLASSETASDDDYSIKQINTFEKIYNAIVLKLGYRPWKHILNSSGIVRFPDHQMDMVRLGIGLYGIDTSNEIQSELEVVFTLKATISQIKTIKKGETIGYNRKGLANKNMRIATISIGYADGLLRGAGNEAYQVFIQGQPASIIGNVCMDMCMVDITDIEEAKEGDEVIIFGHHPSVFSLAKALGTIPYEVFTNISPRVKRVYYQE